MAHRSGSRWPPPPPTTNGLSSEDSPCVMSSEDSHAVGPFGVPYRTTPPSRKAPNNQLQAVFLRLSPAHGLTHARILSSQAPRTRPAPNSALPTPPPRARRTYSLSCSRTAHNSRPRAAPARTHMQQDPARTAQAPTHPLSHRGTWFGTWQSHVPEDSPSRLFASLKRETVTVSCSTPVTHPGGETSPTKFGYVDTPPGGDDTTLCVAPHPCRMEPFTTDREREYFRQRHAHPRPRTPAQTQNRHMVLAHA